MKENLHEEKIKERKNKDKGGREGSTDGLGKDHNLVFGRQIIISNSNKFKKQVCLAEGILLFKYCT